MGAAGDGALWAAPGCRVGREELLGWICVCPQLCVKGWLSTWVSAPRAPLCVAPTATVPDWSSGARMLWDCFKPFLCKLCLGTCSSGLWAG